MEHNRELITSEKAINSKEYWDTRFQSKDWDSFGGGAQTQFFTQIAIDAFPDFLNQELQYRGCELVDLGCAQGDGTALLSRHFPRCTVWGRDFSSQAIEIAKTQYPQCNFAVEDMMEHIAETDVLFCSNVLEHLRGPYDTLTKICEASRKFTVVLLPFQETLEIEEHLHKFGMDFFPLEVGNHYLADFQIINCVPIQNSYYPGQQIMLVYANQNYRSIDYFNLERIYQNIAQYFQPEINALTLEVAQKQAEIAALEAQREAQRMAEEAQRLVEEAQRAAQTAQEEAQRAVQTAREEAQRADQAAREEAHCVALRSLQEENQIQLEQQEQAFQKMQAEERDASQSALQTLEATHREQMEALRREQRIALIKAQESQSTAAQTYQQKIAALEGELSQQSASFQQQISVLQQKVNGLNQTISKVIQLCNAMLQSRLFRFVHFINRANKQGRHKDRAERKKFWQWIRSRRNHIPDFDHRYNPLFAILNCLQESPAERIPMATSISEEGQPVLTPWRDHPVKGLERPYTKQDIIILGVIDYDFRFQRPQHFATRFAENGHRVFYVNPNHHGVQSDREVLPNLHVLSFHNPEINAIYASDWRNAPEALQAHFDVLIQTYGICDATVVVDYPNWILAARYLRRQYGFLFVADYMDDFTGFLNPSEDLVQENCFKLLKESNRIIASSDFLHNIALQHNDTVSIVRNGTDFEHFYQAYGKKATGTQVIGYYGAISHWFDVEKVCYLAKRFPQCRISLIGEVTHGKNELSKCSNIKLLGEKPYGDLPPYLKEFDVCLIPFDTSTDLIKATNPVKFYEYLSAGKKVVTTDIPELEPFRDKYVYMSNDNQRFGDYVQACLDGTDTLATPEEAMVFAKENDWQARYEAFAADAKEVIPKITIIVLTYNNLKLNKACVESILNNTAYANYELLIVDNASTDGTIQYLQSLEAMAYPQVSVIYNQENLGFAGGNNVGIAQATGEFVVLLNNDTLVTRGWLTGMWKHLQNDSTLGMIGPVTNSIGNEGKVPAPYESAQELQAYAQYHSSRYRGQRWENPGVLALFCTMIRKDVLLECGMLDDSYRVGMFEDDDFAEAVRDHGYRLAMADDVLIHHFEGASFKALDTEKYQQIFAENKEKYEKKWHKKWIPHKYRPDVTAPMNAPENRKIYLEIQGTSETDFTAER